MFRGEGGEGGGEFHSTRLMQAFVIREIISSENDGNQNLVPKLFLEI